MRSDRTGLNVTLLNTNAKNRFPAAEDKSRGQYEGLFRR